MSGKTTGILIAEALGWLTMVAMIVAPVWLFLAFFAWIGICI